MRVDDHLHLTYCTNIHPGESWPEVFAGLRQHIPAIRQRLAPGQPFGIGLRLSNRAAGELLAGAELSRFRDWLNQQQCYVFTMNGFPYGGFHGQRVKDQVHAPDWTTPERLEYSLRLISILEQLLPEGMEGGISTSPLSYKPWLPDETHRLTAFERSTEQLLRVVEVLHQIHETKGKVIHLDIEPEPDGLIENTREMIDFFDGWLLPMGRRLFTGRLSHREAEASILRHLRLCYDVCHFAIGYEEPALVLNALRKKGIRIGKVQISAAMQALLGNAAEIRKQLAEELSAFNESTYLHQVVERRTDGRLVHYPDLPEALRQLDHPAEREWRIHFHVPVFIEKYGLLQSTQAEIIKVLQLLKAEKFTSHLEVETYTWEVLPPALQSTLVDSICRELEWVTRQLASSQMNYHA